MNALERNIADDIDEIGKNFDDSTDNVQEVLSKYLHIIARCCYVALKLWFYGIRK